MLEKTELFSDLAREFSCAAKSGTLPPSSAGTAYSYEASEAKVKSLLNLNQLEECNI